MNNIDNMNEDLPNLISKKSFFTIDPYTSVIQYNESLEALKNNKINYVEYISTLGPYNWYLSLEKSQYPIMMNYEKMNNTIWKQCVSKVLPLRPNDVYLLYRRGEKKDIAKYIENDVFKQARNNNSIVFKIKTKEETLSLSKIYGTIYPLGVYFNGSIKLAICFNSEIKNSLTSDRILVEMGSHKPGELEKEINYRALRNQDKIIKYSITPYFKDGKFHQTSPSSPLKIL